MKGQFLVIEGPDGSGKTEQQKALAQRFKQDSGIEIFIADFPQYQQTFGKIVGKMLNDEYGSYRDIHPELAILSYALDRWDSKEQIENALAKGRIVLANRYTLSNMAHQSARLPTEQREDLIRLIEKIEYEKLQIPRPDLYIHLDVPIEITKDLLEKKMQREYLGSEAKKDALERDFEHQLEAAKMYRFLGRNLPGITRVDCVGREGKLMTIPQIHEIVWRETQKFLSKELSEGQISRERQI